MAKTETKTAPKKEAAPKTSKKESLYEIFRGAKVAQHVLQPKKENMLYIVIENEQGEEETHLMDLRAMPLDIVESIVDENE
ncbi:hypothetical protein [Flavobacterium sp.]|uniref:hypothetical protein n=1 Tax=Flavobacterium sp. TaxID=239 RepID=UPI002B4B7EED|nr:hypothetical protein [Flavobacterium sp.]HLF52322.1 hypothetical protein [Flavobacterium sp.]